MTRQPLLGAAHCTILRRTLQDRRNAKCREYTQEVSGVNKLVIQHNAYNIR